MPHDSALDYFLETCLRMRNFADLHDLPMPELILPDPWRSFILSHSFDQSKETPTTIFHSLRVYWEKPHD